MKTFSITIADKTITDTVYRSNILAQLYAEDCEANPEGFNAIFSAPSLTNRRDLWMELNNTLSNQQEDSDYSCILYDHLSFGTVKKEFTRHFENPNGAKYRVAVVPPVAFGPPTIQGRGAIYVVPRVDITNLILPETAVALLATELNDAHRAGALLRQFSKHTDVRLLLPRICEPDTRSPLVWRSSTFAEWREEVASRLQTRLMLDSPGLALAQKA